MFEKEAEEYAIGIERKASKEIVYLTFIDGAEFGYNKALEQVKQILKEWLSDKTHTPKQHNELVKETKNILGE